MRRVTIFMLLLVNSFAQTVASPACGPGQCCVMDANGQSPQNMPNLSGVNNPLFSYCYQAITYPLPFEWWNNHQYYGQRKIKFI